MMGWGGGWWWVIGAIVMVACMYWMGRMMMSHGGHSGSDHQEHGRSDVNANEILAERFARGEISEQEFEERRRVLARHE